jgi:uncharacterized protein (TIGR03435 family)
MKLWNAAAAAVSLGLMAAWLLQAQPETTQPKAAERLEFTVASVKPSPPDTPVNSNFPIGPGDAYTPNGGYFTVTGTPLSAYIGFAYKILGNQMPALARQFPDWVLSDRFDIQARAEGNPTKDQMRSMVRALLADRFKLAMHTETKEGPVEALLVVKEGKLGPQLQAHPADSPCPNDPSQLPAPAPSQANLSPFQTSIAGGFPTLCGGLLMMPPSVPGRLRAGARNVTMEFLANLVGIWAELGRPVLDRSGLPGRFDFNMEWVPTNRGPAPPGAENQTEISGPSFEEALRQQLGLKLESQRGPITGYKLDHVEHPSGN